MIWEQKERADWDTLKRVLHEDPHWKENSLTDSEAELDIRNSGFLIREYDDSYKFVHRSIMEYFAARAEFGRIKSGIKPREIPTDGYRTFLFQILAREWIEQKKDPFPERLWQESMGDTVLSSISNTLSAISFYVSEGDSRYKILDRRSIQINGNQHWRNIDAINCKIKIIDGIVKFEDCFFNNTIFDVLKMPYFINCNFADCSLILGPKEVDIFAENVPFVLDAQLLSYNASLILWYLSYLCQMSISIIWSNKAFNIKFDNVKLLFEVLSRIKGKIFIDYWKKGKMKTIHETILNELIKEGYVDKDTSRQGHQIKISHKGNELLMKAQLRPYEAYDEISRILKIV